MNPTYFSTIPTNMLIVKNFSPLNDFLRSDSIFPGVFASAISDFESLIRTTGDGAPSLAAALEGEPGVVVTFTSLEPYKYTYIQTNERVMNE